MSALKAIVNTQIVTENGIIWDGAILIENGLVAAFGKERDIEIPEDAELIDAHGAYAGPGFVDIHVHGGNGYSTCYDLRKASEYFLKNGTTSILATPDYHMDRDTILKVIDNIKAEMGEARSFRGIYMEGPYTNPDYGSHSDTNPWRKAVLPEDYIPIVDACGALVKVWAIAPERGDLVPFLEYAKKVNPEVKIAVGHSEATPAEIRALGKHRPTILTHSMNATGRQNQAPGLRANGPDEYGFKESNVYCELISDSCAIHVKPDMQQLLLHTKGFEKVVLITDSTTHANPVPKGYEHVTDLNFDPSGGIAGSRMTMDKACRNIMQSTSCGIAQAFIMASTNPAKAIGMDDEIGSIDIGKRADIVLVDDKFNVQKVILKGEMI